MRNEQDVLRTEQYADSHNLNARIALHARFSTNPYNWFRWVFDHFNELPAEAQILEVGCGPCRLWVENRERIPEGWRLTLSDFSAGMLEDAKRNLNLAPPRYRFEIVDVQSIPFPDAAFDAVIANHMLYHVPDRPKALAEIRRVLKPGGVLFAATNGEKNMMDTFTLGKQVHPMLADGARKLITHAPFTLENGGAQLAPLFQSVTIDRYEDALDVTEVDPLVDYILSMSVFDRLPTDREVARKVLQKLVGAEICKHGKVHIEKSTGLFIARRT